MSAQHTFDFEPPRRRGLDEAIAFIRAYPNVFRRDFEAWLRVAWLRVWTPFECEALKVAGIRQHWSANTIVEYLRHETVLRDPTDDAFKFNDRWTSSMARLFVLLHPEHESLFEFRERQTDGVVAMPPRPPEQSHG